MLTGKNFLQNTRALRFVEEQVSTLLVNLCRKKRARRRVSPIFVGSN